MGAIRYQTSGFSIDGIEYRISIYDKSYSGAIVSDFILDSNFFELRYDSGADENYSPIIGSELTLNIQLFNSAARNDRDLFNFLKNMIAQNSQTYYIIIEEKISGNWYNYWRGNVVQDQSTWNNDALEGGKTFKVTANDFAFLNEIPYEVAYSTSGSLRGYMNECFLKLGIYDDFVGNILYYLLHNINWFASAIAVGNRPTTDMLNASFTSNTNFKDLNEEKTQNNINYTDILKTICTIFGCRLIQSNGKFWMIQMSNYADILEKFYQQGIDNSNPTQLSVNPRVNVNNSSGPLKILEGGSYEGIRPFSSVSVKKPRLNSQLGKNKKDPYTNSRMTMTITQVYFTGGGNNTLNLSLKLNHRGIISGGPNVYGSWMQVGTAFNIFDFFSKLQVKFTIKIKTVAGVWWYLRNIGTSDNLEWTTTVSTALVTIPFPNSYIDKDLELDIKTPPLPSFSFVEVFEEHYLYGEGYYVSSSFPTVYSFNTSDLYYNGTAYFDFLENGTYGEETTYEAILSPAPFDPTEKEIDTPLLNDGEDTNLKGLIRVFDGSAFSNSISWGVGASTSYFKILELVVVNALAQNRTVKEKLTATIKGNYYPHQLLTYDSKQWHLKQATYNAGSNQWNGEWWELQFDDNSITVDANISNGDWQDTVLTG
jgi:hypothetical protein